MFDLLDERNLYILLFIEKMLSLIPSHLNIFFQEDNSCATPNSMRQPSASITHAKAPALLTTNPYKGQG